MCQRAITFNLALILALPAALHAADEEATGAEEWRLTSPDEKVVLTIRLPSHKDHYQRRPSPSLVHGRKQHQRHTTHRATHRPDGSTAITP